MKLMEEYIVKYGVVKEGNILKVGTFLNHSMDIQLYREMGKEFKRLFKDVPINKIMTIEASGIGIAIMTANYFDCPAVFAKKSKTSNLSDDLYQSEVHSYTHNTNYKISVSKDCISSEDHILLVDDFLANGCALRGLIDIVHQAGASVEGIGIAIEKGFQEGGKTIRDLGYHLESLAIIESMSEEEIKFKA